jgi:DNA-binding response OmpR family regulator
MRNEVPRPQSRHLLVADDNLADLRLLVRLLQNENFDITVALEGRHAYERALTPLPPELILLDVAMPGMDGLATCRLLKSNPKTNTIPVIFITASNSLGERLGGFDAGGVDYILKPYDPADVLARVRVHLGERHTATPAGAPAEPTLSRQDALVNAAVQYLTHHMSAPPTQKELAKLMDISEKQLAKSFRLRLGKTMNEFLRDERIRTAQHHLASTAATIAEIADHLGFSSAANFATAFRLRVGQSPIEFRKINQVPVATPNSESQP